MVRAFEPPVYCYHEIVHNKLVVDRFKALGVVFVDDIDDVPGRRADHAVGPRLGARGGRRRPRRGAPTSSTRCARSSPRCTTRCGCGPARATESCTSATRATRRPWARWRWRPTAMHRVESVAEVEALPALRRARWPCWPRPRCRTATGRASSTPPSDRFPDAVDAGSLRPVLRHHQPAVGADGDGAPLRRHRRDRLGQLVEHRAPSRSWPARPAARHVAPGQPRRRAARRPDRHRRRDGRCVGARGAGRRRARPPRATPRRRASHRHRRGRVLPAAAQHPRAADRRRAGGDGDARRLASTSTRAVDDRALAASDVLAALAAERAADWPSAVSCGGLPSRPPRGRRARRPAGRAPARRGCCA